jgi:DNA-directed RNA polymerase sigma subunit (sigma70/sigma32)
MLSNTESRGYFDDPRVLQDPRLPEIVEYFGEAAIAMYLSLEDQAKFYEKATAYIAQLRQVAPGQELPSPSAETCLAEVSFHALRRSFSRLVISLARRYASNCQDVHLLELCRAGEMGVQRGLLAYDRRRGGKMNTVIASYVSREMDAAVRC